MSTSGIESPGAKKALENVSRAAQKTTDDSQLLNQLLPEQASSKAEDKVDVSVKDIYKSLTVLAQSVLDKLQEILGDQLPEGIQGLRPEDHTAEKTAQRIVDGTTALLGVFSRQHPDLQGNELITEFMKTIRGGIDQGYSEAEGILGDIGAFDIDGVRSGIDETKKLVEEKLKAFEDNYRKQNGLAEASPEPAESPETPVVPTSVDQVA